MAHELYLDKAIIFESALKAQAWGGRAVAVAVAVAQGGGGERGLCPPPS